MKRAQRQHDEVSDIPKLFNSVPRTTRRYVCSTETPPSVSKAVTRTRKRTRTSSERDGGLNAEPSAKRSAIKLSSPKNVRKATESPKVSLSNLGSLQNTVVLAPFYTLKSSFQTKLVDLYSKKRIKKIRNKSKAAKQQNSCFQYDVIELKSEDSNVKKERRSPKKAKDKSRSVSYCQCKRNSVRRKDSDGAGRKKGPRTRNIGGGEVLSRPSGRREVGRVRASPSVCVPRNSRADLPHRLDFYLGKEKPFLFTGSKSPRYRNNSRETPNNRSPCNEGRMEGSFTISSTSFASYLQQFVRERPEIVRKRRGNAHKNSKRMKEKFLPKPNADSSRHLILRLEKKNSDEHIVHFMDREPQVRIIPSMESNHHLQPLRRQDREKEKKRESDGVATYYLRSFSSSKEKDASELTQSRSKSERLNRGSVHKNTSSLMEVATQAGENGTEENSRAGKTRSRSRQRASTSEVRREKALRDRPVAEPLPETNCPKSPEEPAEDLELSDALLRPPLIDPVGIENPSGLNESVPGEPSDSEPADLPEGLGFRLKDFAQPQVLEDKETDFIFGSSNAVNRLRGSCEFSFGLNSVFPEDED